MAKRKERTGPKDVPDTGEPRLAGQGGESSAVAASVAETAHGTAARIHGELQHLHPSLWELKTNAIGRQRGGIHDSRRLRRDEEGKLKETPQQIYGIERLRRAFAPLRPGDTLYACCSDERCDGPDGQDGSEGSTFLRFATPGTLVLCEDDAIGEATEYLRQLRASGVNVVVCDHFKSCGAYKEQCRRMPGENPTEVARRGGKRIADRLGISDIRMMGYEERDGDIPMRGHEMLHDACQMTVDLSNRLYRPNALGLRPSFKLNRYTRDRQRLIADIKLLLSIAMQEDHAMGRTYFERNKFIVYVVGVADDQDFSFDAFQKTLATELDDLSSAVEIVGYDAPPVEDMDSERKDGESQAA